MEKVKHYNILEKIGSGGMGEIFRAFDTKLERDVALKIMHKSISENAQNSKRLMVEARAAAKLVHPNVVTIYEVGEDERGPFIAMEYVQGDPLSHLIAKSQDLTVDRSIKLAIQVLKALSIAHKNEIFHRDIKPENILVTKNDEVKVLDFGIAKMAHKSGLTMAGEVLGTVEFMAPEQMLGEGIDFRCDIYALGVLLYQSLSRQLPFSGNNPVEILFKKLNEEPVAPSYYNKKVNQQLDHLVLKALRSTKEERWNSADEMIDGLEAIINNQKQSNLLPWDKADDEFENQEDFSDETSNEIRSVFIGRKNEFKKLVSTYNKIHLTGGQTIILSGEAGVGKSTLANQFKSYVEHQDTWLLYGTCLYQEGMDAYLPYIDALRMFFRPDNQKFSDNHRLKLNSLIKEKVPILAEFTERFHTSLATTSWNVKDTGQNDKNNLFEELYLLFSLMAEIKPLVIIIDDLQWADESSLRFFHYLSRQIRNNRIILLGISRTDYYDLQENGKPKLIVEMQSRMRREGIAHEIILNRLVREDCDDLLDKTLGSTAFSENFYQGMFVETKGNPFFVIESLKLFREKGEIFNDNGIWVDKKINFKSEVPNRVEDIFMRRLSGLTEYDRELLQVAAVIGYKFDPSLLIPIIEGQKITVLKKLQKIEREFQIIKSIDKYFQFEHPMLADILYNEIPFVLTREYHLMIAAEMERIFQNNYGSKVSNVAQHLRRGGDHIAAIPLLFRAAERAFDLAAYRESSVFYEDLLDSVTASKQTVPEEISKIDLYFKLGICYEEIDNWSKSIESYNKLVEASDQKNDLSKKADALMRIGRVHDKMGEWEIAVNYYEKSLAIAKEHDIKNIFSRVYNKIGVYHFHTGDYDTALKYFLKTIRFADSEYGEFDKAHAHTNVGIIANIVRGEYGVARENFEKALKIYELHNKKNDQARVYHNIGMFYSDHEEWLESIKAYEKTLKLCGDDEEAKHLRALTYLNMAEAYARQNKIVKAKQLNEKALKMFKRMADILSMAEAYHVYGIIYSAQDDYIKAEKYLKDAINIFKNKSFTEGLAETYETYGKMLLKTDYTSNAVEMLEESAKLFKSINLDTKVKTVTELINSVESELVE